MTEQAKAKTALDVAREWLDKQPHADFCALDFPKTWSKCNCRDYASLAAAIESYAQAAVQRAREEDCAAMCGCCRIGMPVEYRQGRWRHDQVGAFDLCDAHLLLEAHARESEGKEGR